MKHLLSLAIIALSFFIFTPAASAQHGTGAAWLPEVELPKPPASSSARGFLYSNMGAFSGGKRVVFQNRQDGPGGIYHTHSYDGVAWSTPQVFAPSSLVIGLNSPKVIVDHQDKMHVLWASQSPKALYYSQLDTSLGLVIDSVRIADNPEFNKYSAMYICNDLQGRLHVMWNEGETGVHTPEVYYSRSTDSGLTWSPKDTLSTDDALASSFPRGQFNAYAGDSLAIFWRDSSSFGSNNWDIQMVVSEDGGQSWSSPQTINPNMHMQGDPDLVIDPQGRFHLFYHGSIAGDPYWGMRILYGYSDDLGATWQPSSTFEDTVSRDERSYLAEGSRYDTQNGILWTFWKEQDLLGLKGGDMLATYSLDRGLSWSEPEYVTDRGDTSIGFKAVCLLPNGNLAINYELPDYPSSGLMSIFYRERGPIPMSIGPAYLKKAEVQFFPNPVEDILKLRFPDQEEKRLSLYDVHGRQVLQTDLSSGKEEFSWDLSPLPAGMYFLRGTSSTQVYHAKIWVK